MLRIHKRSASNMRLSNAISFRKISSVGKQKRCQSRASCKLCNDIKKALFCIRAEKRFLLHNEYNGNEMQNACQIDAYMPYGMKVFVLRLSIKESTNRIHHTTTDDQSQK